MYESIVESADAHFDYLNLFSDAQAQKVGSPRKKVKTVKEPINTEENAMILSEIRRRIELCMREIILRKSNTAGEYFTHMKMSPLIMNSAKFSPMLGARGLLAGRML
jgi:site-specific recombinase